LSKTRTGEGPHDPCPVMEEGDGRLRTTSLADQHNGGEDHQVCRNGNPAWEAGGRSHVEERARVSVRVRVCVCRCV
jgi:hypothetical protein